MSLAQYLSENQDQFQADLFRLLEIPSVSTDPARKGEVARCAEEVKRQMLQAGLEQVQVFETPGHPVVYGQWLGAVDAPTVLVYGHYDVQPEDPVDLWTSPPFTPTIRDGKVYARGATDDKGQFIAHVKAVQALMKSEGQLPVNVKFVIEGEEEIGSRNLAPFLESHRELLAADVLVVSDSAMFAPGQPSIVYGLRGLAYVEVEVFGADSDLHSGVFGGAVPNPGFELAKIISQLKDEQGRITVPGFYDKVVDLTAQERSDYARLPFDAEEFRKELNVPGLSGEAGYTPLEHRSGRPTLEVNGIGRLRFLQERGPMTDQLRGMQQPALGIALATRLQDLFAMQLPSRPHRFQIVLTELKIALSLTMRGHRQLGGGPIADFQVSGHQEHLQAGLHIEGMMTF